MPEHPDDLLKRLHDVYHAPAEADIHQARHGHAFSDAQPGSAEFTGAHLVGSSAPASHIERWDGVGPEGFGPVELPDGRTGKPIAKINAAARGRLMGA